jgi:pyridoxamine 5'-phosphate oxidase
MGETPDLASLRKAYETTGWDVSTALPDPADQFTAWFADAMAAGIPEPNAMVLATASADGEPSARTVLLKGHGKDGFRFFTNHTSQKGRDLAENPRACLLFPWHAIARQVRVEGTVSRLSDADTAAYFRSRPYGSRLGAWASFQSKVIDSRTELDRRYAELEQRWPDDVPVPDFWGGYLVEPHAIEFWQGRADRLHDRIKYMKTDKGWAVVRLSP